MGTVGFARAWPPLSVKKCFLISSPNFLSGPLQYHPWSYGRLLLMSGSHRECGICVWRKKRKKTGQNQYIEINVPLWRFKTDGEKVKDSLLLSAFLWQLQCVCYEWAVICSSCWIIKGAAFPADLGMLVMAYLLCADQVSTGRTPPAHESFSQS